MFVTEGSNVANYCGGMPECTKFVDYPDVPRCLIPEGCTVGGVFHPAGSLVTPAPASAAPACTNCGQKYLAIGVVALAVWWLL